MIFYRHFLLLLPVLIAHAIAKRFAVGQLGGTNTLWPWTSSSSEEEPTHTEQHPVVLKRPLANVSNAVLIEQSEEASVELTCPSLNQSEAALLGLASSLFRPLVQWSFNGVPLHELPEDTRRLLLDGGSIIRIVDLSHDLDSGLYECSAASPLTHPGITFNGSVELRVLATAPRFLMPSHREWKVIRHSRVDMDCDVEAAPPAVIRWVDANDSLIPLIDGKIELLPKEKWTLRVYDVNSQDAGAYYCNVSNKYGINRATNRLDIYQPTYFVRIPEERLLAVDAGAALELDCQAKADERVTLEYRWTRNGRRINETYVSTSDEGVSQLRIAHLRGHHSGRIECTVVTEVDTKVASAVDLLVRDVPEAPEIAKIQCLVDVGPLQALIVWHRPEEHGSPLSNFLLEQRIIGFPGENWEVVREERHSLNRDIYKFLAPLSPWGNYTYRLSAVNAYGTSAFTHSNGTIACRTPSDVPHSNPRGVRVFGTQPDNLVIAWEPMRRRDWNAPGLRYLVRYREHLVDGDMVEMDREEQELVRWTEFIVDDPLANETTIRDVPTFHLYEVQVRAVNSKGYSAVPPVTYRGYSGEAQPSEAPSNLQLTKHINHSAVEITWDGVEPASVYGHFLGYKVVYWRTEWPYHTHELQAENTSTTVLVTGLEAMGNYTVKVTVVNGQYEGVWSDWLHFRTREGAPTKVDALTVRAVGARSLLATWQPPLQTNGHLRGYFITFENVTSGYVEETYVLHRQLHYLHEALEPDSPYMLSVWAETNGGEGPRVSRAVRTHPLRKPDEPQFSIAVITPTSVLLRWEPFPQNHSSFSGTTFHVKYARAEAENGVNGSTPVKRWWHRSPKANLPSVELQLLNLQPATDYLLVGVAEEASTNLSQEAIVAKEFRTDSYSLMHRISPERLRQAAWFIAVLAALTLALLTVSATCYLAQRRQFYQLYQPDSTSTFRASGTSFDLKASMATGTYSSGFVSDGEQDPQRRGMKGGTGEQVSVDSGAKYGRLAEMRQRFFQSRTVYRAIETPRVEKEEVNEAHV